MAVDSAVMEGCGTLYLSVLSLFIMYKNVSWRKSETLDVEYVSKNCEEGSEPGAFVACINDKLLSGLRIIEPAGKHAPLYVN